MFKTASMIAYEGAGRPEIIYPTVSHSGHCACCGGVIEGEAVPISEIENPTFTQHGDFLAHGKYVCPACAWLFGAGKGKPGNFIATPMRYEQTVISLKSVVYNKRPWQTVIREVAAMPKNTPVCGVLTTDVKPRLWPRMRAATVGAFGLYVHSPDDDLSDYIDMPIDDLSAIIDIVLPALALKFSKQNLRHGLYQNQKIFQKHFSAAVALERQIAPWRVHPAFIPAVLMAGV